MYPQTKRQNSNGDNANTNEVWDTTREFPMMFDIADRAQKYRTQRGKR